MSNITQAWQNARVVYSLRYVSYLKEYKKNPNNKEALGHMHECSYVLINIFGLTSKQVEEIEHNGGITNDDIEESKRRKENE